MAVGIPVGFRTAVVVKEEDWKLQRERDVWLGVEEAADPFKLGLGFGFRKKRRKKGFGISMEEEQEGVEDLKVEIGRPAVLLVCGSLVYYHCAYRQSSILSLFSDVLIVLLCSLAILGMLFRQMNISVPVDPLEWQISQDTANGIAACLANTIGAAESVLRVAATGHDKRLFFKVVFILYLLSVLGRSASGATVTYAGLCLFCLYIFAQSSQLINMFAGRFPRKNDSTTGTQDAM